MGMVVQHNMNALNSYNKLNANVAGMKKSSEKLSSGYRINRAGDDAAGLAVSEKMRSQIKGLNQAIRNSQDGINMIQTFEGAAQETHSILQRMKELASQSANGTYDNATDRAAIQLEFDQLNDELNQIADTDFNGTIVLNGGQMADGTKAVNNVFNYNTKTRDAMQLSAKDVNLVDGQAFDDTDDTVARTVADTVWNDLNAEWDRSDPAKQGPDSVELTFKYDAKGGADGATFWSIVGGSNGVDTTAITPVTSTDNGGFSISTANAANFANVVLDQTKLQNGDTITLKLNNPAASIAAPTNAGATVADASSFVAGADPATSIQLNDANLSVTVEDIDFADYTKGMDSFFKALDGATATASYTAAAATAKGDVELTLSDGTAVTGTTDGAVTLGDGTKVWAAFTAGKVEFWTYDAANAKKGTQQLATVEMTANKGAGDASSGDITYNIGLDFNSFGDNQPSIEVAAPAAGTNVSKANAFDNSKAIMTYAQDITLQVGARTKDAVNFTFKYNTDGTADMGDLTANLNISARKDGLNTENLSLATADDANAAIDQIDKAINKVSMVRASFGSIQNRLEHKITNLTTTSENLTEAESSIRDTDMASEMMNYTKFNILQQAAQSMLAQANQQPQSILQLLG